MIMSQLMKITREQVEKIIALIIERLKEKDLIVYKAEEEKVLKKMQDAFLADLKAEDDLDREVEGILSSHSTAIDSQRLDYRKMFNMIKMKLARERGIVL